MINTAQAATGAGPSTRAKFCFWVRQRFACWRAKFAGRLTSDKPPTTISHCCGPNGSASAWEERGMTIPDGCVKPTFQAEDVLILPEATLHCVMPWAAEGGRDVR